MFSKCSLVFNCILKFVFFKNILQSILPLDGVGARACMILLSCPSTQRFSNSPREEYWSQKMSSVRCLVLSLATISRCFYKMASSPGWVKGRNQLPSTALPDQPRSPSIASGAEAVSHTQQLPRAADCRFP